MPVLSSTDSIAPRSVLRHRPIAEDGKHPGKRSVVTAATTPAIKRASRLRAHTEDAHSADAHDANIEVDEWQRVTDDDDSLPNTQPPRTPIRRASATTPSRPLPKTPRPRATVMASMTKRQAHPLLYLGIGMLGMLALWVVL